MRHACLQFQPDRVPKADQQITAELHRLFSDGEFSIGVDDGRYLNVLFWVPSPAAALARVEVLFSLPTLGQPARASVIVTCEGNQGWDNYLLLHHYDRTLVSDRVPAIPAAG